MLQREVFLSFGYTLCLFLLVGFGSCIGSISDNLSQPRQTNQTTTPTNVATDHQQQPRYRQPGIATTQRPKETNQSINQNQVVARTHVQAVATRSFTQEGKGDDKSNSVSFYTRLPHENFEANPSSSHQYANYQLQSQSNHHTQNNDYENNNHMQASQNRPISASRQQQHKLNNAPTHHHHHHRQQQHQQNEGQHYHAPNIGAGSGRVPFWNIGHMINSIEKVDEVLSLGANGIETDVSFDYVPDPPLGDKYVSQDVHPIKASAFHGLPCDCFRLCQNQEDFVAFVKYIKSVTTRSNNTLSVMLLDLKLTTKELNDTKKAYIGDYLAQTLMNILYKNLNDYQNRKPIRTILSINYVTDHMVVRTFMERLRHDRLEQRMQYIGFDVGMNDMLENITAMWDELSPDRGLNIWQGDGLTNCANIVRKIDRLKEAISLRNARGHFRKVYYWTVDVKTQLRNILRLGLDAVLTNQPERIVEVLAEEEFRAKYRLATVNDDPFRQLNIEPMPWKLPGLDDLGETVENIKQTGSEYFRDLPLGIAKALQKKITTVIAESGYV